MSDNTNFHSNVLDNDAKREILLAEIKILSNAIITADSQSNQINQWWIACWGLVFTEHIIPGLIDLNYYVTFSITLVPVLFAIQDVMAKRNQRKLLWRTRAIHSRLNFDGAEKNYNRLSSLRYCRSLAGLQHAKIRAGERKLQKIHFPNKGFLGIYFY